MKRNVQTSILLLLSLIWICISNTGCFTALMINNNTINWNMDTIQGVYKSDDNKFTTELKMKASERKFKKDYHFTTDLNFIEHAKKNKQSDKELYRKGIRVLSYNTEIDSIATIYLHKKAMAKGRLDKSSENLIPDSMISQSINSINLSCDEKSDQKIPCYKFELPMVTSLKIKVILFIPFTIVCDIISLPVQLIFAIILGNYHYKTNE